MPKLKFVSEAVYDQNGMQALLVMFNLTRNIKVSLEEPKISREYKADYVNAEWAEGKPGAHEKLLQRAYLIFLCGKSIYDISAEKLNVDERVVCSALKFNTLYLDENEDPSPSL